MQPLMNPLITTVLQPLCQDSGGGGCCDDDCGYGPTEWAVCEADRRPTLHTACLLALADNNGEFIYFANEVIQPVPLDPTFELSIDPFEQVLIELNLDIHYPD